MVDVKEGFAALYHYLATSEDALPQTVRRTKRAMHRFEITPPAAVIKPLLHGYLAARSAREFGMRVFVCQPFFRAYCKACGPGLRTGEFIHWVQGQGDIVVGSNVWVDGKSTFSFAASFTERPTLVIGDNTGIGHNCFFAVGKRITIGKHVNISGSVMIFDSNGHPSDPVARRLHEPPPKDQVRPVTIGDDVWIGKKSIIFPGVRVGDAAIISAGSVVRRHVPAYGVVAGNPAQLVFRLPRPAKSTEEKAEIAKRAEAMVASSAL
ncbi:Acetyltransferase [Minicystis rosea]|nr:Acetyltransferase [Minicystis rosea]